MKVILTQTVPGLGDAGTIKEVADGYARNYLIPKKLASVATKGTMKQAEAQAELIARRATKARDETQKVASVLDGKSVTIRAKVGSESRLYGSITAADVADAIGQQLGMEIDRRRIELAEAIHRLGSFSATADFGSGITSNFTVEVAPEVAGAHGRAAKSDAGKAEAEAEAEAPAAPESEEPLEQEAEANPS